MVFVPSLGLSSFNAVFDCGPAGAAVEPLRPDPKSLLSHPM
jgi:hypothetical protein